MADGQSEKLLASYDFVEREVDLDGALDIGKIALATALSWIDFRKLPSFKEYSSTFDKLVRSLRKACIHAGDRLLR